MAEDTGAADPSMEEILASIRKIISDDGPPIEVAPAPAPEPVVEATPPAPPAPPEEDILELTQMVEEDGTVTDLNAAAPLEPTPAPPAPEPAPVPVPPPPPSPPPPVMGEPLVSNPAAQSAASALSALANTVEIERLSSLPHSMTALGNGGRTLEDMVIELMRPLLKDWLDQNLPAVVDRLVQKEIERIARRS